MNKGHSNPFSNAFRGIVASYHTERNMKVHLVLGLLAVTLGVWMDLRASEWRWIGLCIALVFIAELANTAIETLVDLVSPNDHPLAKKAKDAAAGAVLVASGLAAVIGVSIFFPKVWTYFFG
ncbi:diacylglycerol kinase family protein [Parapedobacter deserti]|uniref:Diacylglycerol kinase family protein n=1 Tax=Parapedobacter deserti TaxID=1912957 RepID=A0ABV7JK28_9SPHI